MDKLIDINQISNAETFLAYCKQNFGMMSKKDFELAVFHLMLQDDFKEKTDFSISYSMGITESRVKQLRYEENLRFKKDDNYYHEKLLHILENSSFKFTDNDKKIQFCVNDKMLRLYLNDRLNQVGSFADSSFNSNIISVTAKDILFLLGTQKHNSTIGQINKSLQENNKELPISTKQALSKLTTAIITDAGKHIAPKLAKWIEEQISSII